MDQARDSGRPHEGSDVYDASDSRRDERRAAVAHMIRENREGLGMKVIAVMVQRYGVLPKDMWDLNRISDMGAGRGVTYHHSLPEDTYASIRNNNRYNIINLTIGEGVSRMVELPDSLRHLQIMSRTYKYSLDLPATLQELSFNWNCEYDKPLLIPSSLRKLELARYYTLPLTFPMGSELVELEPGDNYDQPLNLPHRLKQLTFNWSSHFNSPLVLPARITHVYLGDSYNQPTTLPSEIKELRIGSEFSYGLSLPDSLRKLEWHCDCSIEIPEGVSEVYFDDPFNKPLTLPSTLKKATFFGLRYTHPLNLPSGVEELEWHVRSDTPLLLPESLQKLTWCSTCSVNLPSRLKELVLLQNAPLILPEGLSKVTIDALGTRKLYMVEGYEDFGLENHFDQELAFTHPTTLQHLIVRYPASDSKMDLSNYRIHKLTIGRPSVRIKAWPQELKELEFTVDSMDYTLRVPKGCRIVGEIRPANVIME